MAKNNPEISVIVITYNQEKTISRTLESILNQQLSEKFEIIIGEDCSTDNTPNICDEYQSKYPDIIRVIHNRYNKGIRDNYYDCILASKGLYIADCAGDDFWIDSFKLQKQYDILKNNPDISLVHTGWKYYDTKNYSMRESDPKGTRLPYLKNISDKNALLVPILRRDSPVIIHLCTSMYRKDIFMVEYSRDPELFRNKEFTCEDIQIETIMTANGKIAYLPDITLAYQTGEKSATSDESFAKTFNFYYGTLKLNRYIQIKYGIPDNELKKYYDNIIPYLYSQLFYAGSSERHRYKEFKKYVNKIPYKNKFKTYIYKLMLELRISGLLQRFFHT